MQGRISTCALFFLLVLACGPARAGTVYDINAAATAGGTTYATLEDFRQAGVALQDGDTLVLHNDDDSLTAALAIAGTNNITIRSASGRQITIDGPQNDYLIAGTTIAGETLNLTIAVDNSSPHVTRWTSGFSATGAGTNTVTVDVAAGKIFDQQAAAVVSGRLEKTGGGVYRVQGGVVTIADIKEGTMHFRPGLWAGTNLTVRSGATMKITVNPGTNLTDWLEDDTTVLNGYETSRFVLGSLTGEAGARLEIGDISKFPVFPHTWTDGDTTTRSTLFVRAVVVTPGTTGASAIPESMNIDNKLLTAKWYAVDWNGFTGRSSDDNWQEVVEKMDDADRDSYMLHISKVSDLAVLNGISGYADVYRKMNLSDVERDMLDSIYARGAASNRDLAFLQTLGGHVVQNAMLALRNNQLDLLRRVNRRVTAYQREELAQLPAVTGSEYCFYSDEDPAVNYGELWGYMDAAFDRQDDVGGIAGYKWDRYGMGLGYDWHVDQLIIGGAVSYTMGKMELASSSATKTDIKNLIAAVYGSWASDGWYITGSGFAGYGWNETDSAYHLDGATPAVARTGNYGATTVGLGLEVGYMMETFFLGVPVRVTPYGGLVYSRTTRNAAREQGGILNDGTNDIDLNRQFRSGRWNSWDGSLGFRLTAPIDREKYILLPSLDVAWIRNGGDAKSDSGDVSLIRDPSATWSLPVTGPNRSALRIAAGLDARIGDRLNIGASYEFEWRKRADRHRFNVNVSMGF